MTPACKVIATPGCELGEGLLWDVAAERLWFVDILGQRLLSVAADGSDLRTHHSPQRLGWAIPCRDQADWLAGFQQGFALVSPDEGNMQPRWLAQPFMGQPALRLNDAKADSSGAVWAGSMNHEDASRSDGSLFRLSAAGQLSVVDTGYRVANGPAIHPDETLLLHTDSARRTIYAFDLDVASGQLSGKRVWARFDETEGYPDGMCFDALGCLWVAHWGAGRVTRRDLAGKVLQRYDLPTPLITNVCFGGAQLDRVYVTSARTGMTAEELRLCPDAGALFEILGHGATGLPAHGFGSGQANSAT
jgi:sugar lactone lactonase YvrE